MSTNTTKARPVHEVRIGTIKAAIWQTNTEHGLRHNVTFSRLYKDGDQWQSSDSFGRDDLLLLGKVADRVHSFLVNQPQRNDPPKAGGGHAPPASSTSRPRHDS